MSKKISDIGEFGLIESIAGLCPSTPGVLTGIGDDAAVLERGQGRVSLFTTDMLVEDVHFRKTDPPEWIGRKALAVNLSDIAAMGGVPTAAVVSLGVPSRCPIKFVRGMYAGMGRLARETKTAVVGGDTVRSEKILVNIALLGKARKKDVVYRKGAKTGDGIFVTGPLGRAWKTDKHFRFIPRLKESQFLIKNFQPTSMIDISDGLSADLGHILEASRVGARLQAKEIPLNAGATLREALSDGEDFELLFTVPARHLKAVKKKPAFKQIGTITSGPVRLEIEFPDGKVQRILPAGYRHF